MMPLLRLLGTPLVNYAEELAHALSWTPFGYGGCQMFPRVSEVKTKGKVYRYLRLVENYRNQNGRKSQRVVCNLGRLEELQKGKLDELTEKLRKFCKKTAAISPTRKTNPP